MEGEAAGGAAAAPRLFIVAGETLSGVLVAQGGDNKGVCVEAVVVQGLEAGD